MNHIYHTIYRLSRVKDTIYGFFYAPVVLVLVLVLVDVLDEVDVEVDVDVLDEVDVEVEVVVVVEVKWFKFSSLAANHDHLVFDTPLT